MKLLSTFAFLGASAIWASAQETRARTVTFDGAAYTKAPSPRILTEGGIPVGNAAALQFDDKFTVINIQDGIRVVNPDTQPNVAVVSGTTGVSLGSVQRLDGNPRFNLESLYFRCARKLLTVFTPVQCSLLLSGSGGQSRLIEGEEGLGSSMQFAEPGLTDLSSVRFTVSTPTDPDLVNVTLILDTVKVQS